MSKYISNPDPDRVREVFDYDGETGDLIRRKNNRITGSLSDIGYKYTKMDGFTLPAHRLVYIWHHGKIPEGHHIDHIDHNRSNNRIENLQAVPASVNLGKHKTSRYRKVYKTKNAKQWIAKPSILLGVYDTEEEAAEIIEKFKKMEDTLRKKFFESLEPAPENKKLKKRV
jgi:hypothetical protein